MKPHGNKGRRKAETKLSDYSELLDNLLCSGITNSSVVLDRLREQGCEGGLTIVKDYISEHRNLVPAPRVLAIATPKRLSRIPQKAPSTFENFDMERLCTEARRQVNSLKALSFISAKRNVIMIGPTGTGKTHLVMAI